MLLDTGNKNVYGLGMGISVVFEIYNFPFLGVGVDPRGHILNVLHILPD
jgi:hypothetical protein